MPGRTSKSSKHRLVLATLTGVLGAGLVLGSAACGQRPGAAAGTNDSTPESAATATADDGPKTTPGASGPETTGSERTPGSPAPAGTSGPGTGESSGSRTVVLRLDKLGEKQMPIPYWTRQGGGGTILGGSRAVETGRLDGFGVLADGRYAGVSADEDGKPAMAIFDASDSAILDMMGQSGPVVMADGKRFAWTSSDEKELVVAEAETGNIVRRKRFGFQVDYVMGFVGGGSQVVVNTENGAKLFDPASGRSSDLGWTHVSAVSPGQDMLGVQNPKGCYEIRHSDKKIWENCDLAPVSISPDGRYAVAQPADTDGAGPRTLTVIELESGRSVLEIRADLLNQVTWSPKNEVVLAAADRNKYALVICSVGGQCARGTKALGWAGPGDEEPPYAIPTN